MLLYRIVEQHYPAFAALLEAQGRPMPRFVQQEFDAYLKCGRLEHGFLRVRCEVCHDERLVAFSCKRRGFCPSCGARRMTEGAALLVDDILPEEPMRQWVLSVPIPLRFVFASQPAIMGKVLGIVQRALATHLSHKAGYTRGAAQTGAVTLIQRFGSALNLNVHFHMLFLDGVYTLEPKPKFHRVKAPTHDELNRLVHTISRRTARFLECRGLLVRDAENSYLELDNEQDPMDTVLGHSVTYRIAVGPHAGREVFTLQTVPAIEPKTSSRVAKLGGFSLHAGVVAEACQRDKLERLCRYITRPALSEKRLSLTPGGNIRYQLKTPYRNGTTHVMFEPLDFVARLAALVPKPRVNLTRFHGVFAPHSKHRALVTPAKRGMGNVQPGPRCIGVRRPAMSWAKRLKRVFNIDVETCQQCGGALRIIASIEEPTVIRRIIEHLDRKKTATLSAPTPGARAPPAKGPLD